MLRASFGIVFLGFGVLKFVPGLSPAEGLAEETIEALTLGLMPGSVGLVVAASVRIRRGGVDRDEPASDCTT